MVECEHEIFQQQQNKSNHKNTSSNCHDEGTQYTQVSDETNYNSSGQINNDSSNVCFNYKSIMPKDAESRRILRSRSYYEVLGISQSATEDAIKKTYKRVLKITLVTISLLLNIILIKIIAQMLMKYSTK